MKTYFVFILFFAVPNAFADFDRPLFKNSQTLEDSEILEDEKIKLNCFVFKTYIVLEKEEPGFLGKNLYYKENTINKKVSLESYCRDIKFDSYKKLGTSGSNFYGIFRRLCLYGWLRFDQVTHS